MYYLFISEERKEGLILTKSEDEKTINSLKDDFNNQFSNFILTVSNEVLISSKYEKTLCLSVDMKILPTTHLQKLVCSGGIIKKEEW